MADSPFLASKEAVVSWSGKAYHNIGQLGRGGSAYAYKVLCTNGPNKGVVFALKLFRQPSRTGWDINFLREAHFLTTSNHPAIMRVFDEGVHRGEYPFVVMEFLPQTLSQVIRERNSGRERSMAQLVSFATQLVSALDYMANADPPVIHRDIKPTNIFIKAGSAVLGDFGLVKHLGREPEERSGPVGPEMPQRYRTPDLVRFFTEGIVPTAKSDIFQLGLVLAELFTGVNPEQPAAFAAPVSLDALPEIRDPLGGPIAAILERMLTIPVEERPTAADLIPVWCDTLLQAFENERRVDGSVESVRTISEADDASPAQASNQQD